MATHTDRHGDPATITTVIHTNTGQRSIRLETSAPLYVFTPDQARQLAADLTAAADDMDARLLVIPGQ